MSWSCFSFGVKVACHLATNSAVFASIFILI